MQLRPFNKSRALVVCLEGADGVGKNTQACLLANRFLDAGKKARVVSAPVPDAAYYADIYAMLEDGRAKSEPELFQSLQVLNRVDFQGRCVPSLISELDCLVLDRWSASTYAYGLAMDTDESWIDTLSEPLIKPDITIILDGPCHRKDGRDVYETDTPFQVKVRSEYQKLATKPGFACVSSGQPMRDVASDIWSIVEKLLGGE